jgi:hypothetical protein
MDPAFERDWPASPRRRHQHASPRTGRMTAFPAGLFAPGRVRDVPHFLDTIFGLASHEGHSGVVQFGGWTLAYGPVRLRPGRSSFIDSGPPHSTHPVTFFFALDLTRLRQVSCIYIIINRLVFFFFFFFEILRGFDDRFMSVDLFFFFSTNTMYELRFDVG